jgi:hypothetical protein
MYSLLVSISYPISRSLRNTNSVSCERRTALQEAVNDIKTRRAKQLTAQNATILVKIREKEKEQPRFFARIAELIAEREALAAENFKLEIKNEE